MGELGHIFLRGEMEMKGVARGGRVRESRAEQQEWTRSKAGRSTENPVIEFILIIATLMSSYSIVILISLTLCLFTSSQFVLLTRPSLRWLPSGCRGCCCSSLPNTSICPSFAMSRLKPPALAWGVTGWDGCWHHSVINTVLWRLYTWKLSCTWLL